MCLLYSPYSGRHTHAHAHTQVLTMCIWSGLSLAAIIQALSFGPIGNNMAPSFEYNDTYTTKSLIHFSFSQGYKACLLVGASNNHIFTVNEVVKETSIIPKSPLLPNLNDNTIIFHTWCHFILPVYHWADRMIVFGSNHKQPEHQSDLYWWNNITII